LTHHFSFSTPLTG